VVPDCFTGANACRAAARRQIGGESGATMKRSSLLPRALIIASVLCGASTQFLAQTGGQTTKTPPQSGPVRPPESGLRGGNGATTKPGSHESSTKDEIDRITGKFPAPKETHDDRDQRPESTAFVDVVVLNEQRQVVTLTRDDLRVAIDGGPRKVVSIHYVFRGPQALVAGRSIAVGKGAIARGDEARTIIVAVDETSFPRADGKTVTPAIQHVLDLIGPTDRAAVIALPQPGPVKFAGNRGDLLESVTRIVGRAPAAGVLLPSVDGLARVLNDLARFEGPKSVLFFSAGAGVSDHRAAGHPHGQPPAVSAVVEAAAASRSVVHVVTAPGGFESNDLRALARSTGGTVTRLTGDARDLAPLAAALLGGYLLEIEARVGDRDGRTHALAITTTQRGVQILAATRWVLRHDPLPLPVGGPNRRHSGNS
jgi:hypothetical protein